MSALGTTTPAEATMTDGDARRALKADLARFNCRVHQPDDPPLFTREPTSDMQNVHWRWTDLEPLLERVGAAIAIGSGGQRRTLRLANPGLAFGTTHTFWGSIQYILPGEVAAAHRHTANAFRFILHGTGCSTTVDGECYEMNEGDLVLTPSMAWHDHVHRGSEPMIWLDVLDISLSRSLQATFFDPYDQGDMQPLDSVPERSYRAFGSGVMGSPRAPYRRGSNPLLAYPRQQAETALELACGLPADPCDDVILEYRNPVEGGPAMKTLGMKLQKIRAGFRGQPRRHTGSKLLCVLRGHGSTLVDGQRYDWAPGDFIAIKPWAWHAHLNASGEDALLFQVDDSPALQALGYYREELLSPHDGQAADEGMQ
ncbi:cupin domain-containing protein [Pseudomonas sp. RIT-PI-AD]|uniref:cupin domain-containing protein n=1 Tax=Pseudomonas sp. RIT-PI-AD TaxID=3035294 RepID=UPI0021D9EDB3|nr:cupin domain-containing protein [Pseudomonas sp. RIT-PI-AD]